ncbi:hypothetical protein Tcan_01953 [Toxocara canis]|uniref:Uncharacterized protein n=1 Tax=Toxocara canis TaxID=6265 RepID=A0A0B2VQ42_TOXCA|nr:hypothetical protein Tcan_01953 [Toxocara canis]
MSFLTPLCAVVAPMLILSFCHPALAEDIFEQKGSSKVCLGSIFIVVCIPLFFLCPDPSAFHYYECCGTIFNECCFRLQTWVIVVLVVLAALVLISAVISLIKCIFCCD